MCTAYRVDVNERNDFETSKSSSKYNLLYFSIDSLPPNGLDNFRSPLDVAANSLS